METMIIIALCGGILLSILAFLDLKLTKKRIKLSFNNLNSLLEKKCKLATDLIDLIEKQTNVEKEKIHEILKSRQNYKTAVTIEGKISSIKNFSVTLDDLLDKLEIEEQFKNNGDFLVMKSHLNNLDGKISFYQKDFNDSIRDFNKKLYNFPTNIFAGKFGFQEVKY